MMFMKEKFNLSEMTENISGSRKKVTLRNNEKGETT